jgi:FKBP-type peptidyl-prolyl cis-trans isomerase
MREGDKWEVVIPSHLGYGAKGTGAGNIGANETLVFLIELVEVEDPAKKAEAKSP